MIFAIFRKVVVASRHGIYRVFGPDASKLTLPRISLGTKKMRSPTTSHSFLVGVKSQSAMCDPSPNLFIAISEGIQEMRVGGVPPVGGLQLGLLE